MCLFHFVLVFYERNGISKAMFVGMVIDEDAESFNMASKYVECIIFLQYLN